MKKNLLYALWGGLFILCAGLGFIPEPTGALKALMRSLSLLTFLPPAILLYRASRQQDRQTVLLIRNLSALWLALTLVLLILNFLSAGSNEIWGSILYYTLVIVTSPMIASHHWAMTMFAWACLLMASLRQLRNQ